jgi:hypothetical protein
VLIATARFHPPPHCFSLCVSVAVDCPPAPMSAVAECRASRVAGRRRRHLEHSCRKTAAISSNKENATAASAPPATTELATAAVAGKSKATEADEEVAYIVVFSQSVSQFGQNALLRTQRLERESKQTVIANSAENCACAADGRAAEEVSTTMRGPE